MKTKMNSSSDVDAYIAAQDPEVQEMLNKVRSTIKAAAPEAEERIGYGMPGYYLNGPLVYFAAFKNHIGFYPTPHGMTAFEEELKQYVQGKGSVQFPISKPMPLSLIKKMVKQRVQENLAKTAKPSAKKSVKKT